MTINIFLWVQISLLQYLQSSSMQSAQMEKLQGKQ